MGCDYYIVQKLCIFYNDNSCYCLNLKRERGYYDDFIMNINMQNSNLTQLTPKISQFIIYTNRSYTNEYVENKYEAMVEFEMIHNNRNWTEIKDIVLYEER